MSKVSIIGAGFVGSTVAHWAMIAGGCQIVLVDVVEGLAKGKVLDLIQAGPIAGHAIDAIGTTDYGRDGQLRHRHHHRRRRAEARHDARGSGAASTPTSSAAWSRRSSQYSPNCIIIMMTNPLDTMTYLAYKLSGFPASG